MPDARVIPLDEGDRSGRLAASRAARDVGAPRPPTPRKRPTPARAGGPDTGAPPAGAAHETADSFGYADPQPDDTHIDPDHTDTLGDARADASPTPGSVAGFEARAVDWLAFLRRRLTGDYAVDEFGFDAELTDTRSAGRAAPALPALVPGRGARHREHPRRRAARWSSPTTPARSPIDSLMTQVAVHDEHPARRHLRMLGADLVFQTPVRRRARPQDRARPWPATTTPSGCCPTASSSGSGPRASRASASRSRERYKLQRFGRGGFVSAALRTGVPIIPCSIVGAEEIYPIIGNIKTLARLLGAALRPDHADLPAGSARSGLIPLPSKWIIEFGEPIATDDLRPGRGRRPDARLQPHRPGARDDPADALRAAHAAPLRLLLTPARPLLHRRSHVPGSFTASARRHAAARAELACRRR